MRLVDLQVGTDNGVHLELHPRLNVVIASAALQERVAALLGRAYVLAGTEVTGTVDGGDYLTPLDPTAVVALDLIGEGLDRIGPADLPAPDPTARQRARAVLEARIDAATTARGELVGERDRIARLHAATEAAVAAGTEEREECGARREALDVSAGALDARRPALAAERDSAGHAADVAAGRLEELCGVRAALATELGPGEDGADIRMGDDTGELVALVDRAGALGGLPAQQMDEVRTWLRDVARSQVPVRADAQALLAEVDAVERAWQLVARPGVEGDSEVAALASERADLDTNHQLLRGLAASGMLGDTAKSQIDASHIALLQASKAQEADAAAAEQAVLARYGFDSYLEYTIATSTRSVGQAVEAKLADLEEHIESLDRDLAAARSRVAGRIEQLAAAREPAQQKVSALLGFRPEGSSIDVLSRIPEVPHSVTRLTLAVDEAIETARDEVARYRGTIADLDDEEVSLGERARELVGQREQIDARIADLDAALADAVPEAGSLAGRLADAEAGVVNATRDLSGITDERDQLDAVPADRYGPDDVVPVVEAVLRRLDPWATNPPPVVLCDTFGPLPPAQAIAALEAVTARADRSQILYLTSSSEVRDWAKRLDPSVGRLINLAHGRWSPRRLGRKVLGRRQSG